MSPHDNHQIYQLCTLTLKSIELMSPAGSQEALMAAIKAGCDAVYFGVEQLNMRARSSNNFTLELHLPKIALSLPSKGLKPRTSHTQYHFVRPRHSTDEVYRWYQRKVVFQLS